MTHAATTIHGPRASHRYSGSDASVDNCAVPDRSGLVTAAVSLDKYGEARLCRSYKVFRRLHNEVQHLRSQARKHANPEHLIHYKVGVGHLADNAILPTLIGRLAQQVARKQQPRPNLLCL